MLEVLASIIWQEKDIEEIWICKEEIKLFPFADDISVYSDNSRNLPNTSKRAQQDYRIQDKCKKNGIIYSSTEHMNTKL